MFLVFLGTGGLAFVALALFVLGQNAQILLYLLYLGMTCSQVYCGYEYAACSWAAVINLTGRCMSGLNRVWRWSKSCWAGRVVAVA